MIWCVGRAARVKETLGWCPGKEIASWRHKGCLPVAGMVGRQGLLVVGGQCALAPHCGCAGVDQRVGKGG